MYTHVFEWVKEVWKKCVSLYTIKMTCYMIVPLFTVWIENKNKDSKMRLGNRNFVVLGPASYRV